MLSVGPTYLRVTNENSKQFNCLVHTFSIWKLEVLKNYEGLFSSRLSWCDIRQTNERTKGEECLKLQFWSFKISQMSCWVLLFLRCHHQIFVCTQDCRVWRNFKWLWWTSLLLSFDAAVDADVSFWCSKNKHFSLYNWWNLGGKSCTRTLFTTFMNLWSTVVQCAYRILSIKLAELFIK